MRLVAAASSDLQRVVYDAQAGFRCPQLGDRGFERDAINADIVECRRNGYALTRDQVILNEISLAAPITGPGGRSEAAVQVSVSGLSYDFDEVRARILPAVLDTANGILA